MSKAVQRNRQPPARGDVSGAPVVLAMAALLLALGCSEIERTQPDTPQPGGPSAEPAADARRAGGEFRLPLGADYSPRRTLFRVFAPSAERVELRLFETPGAAEPMARHQLQPASGGIWELAVDGDLAGRFYSYSLAGPGHDPQFEAVDLYATNTVRSGSRARITDLDRTDPPDWERLRHGPALASPTDAVVYEVHIRDLTSHRASGVRKRKLYLGWTEQGTHVPGDPRVATALEHLDELGVTHVHILPVQDFQNDESADLYNWGYITNNFFAPEGVYATSIDDESRIRELKALIAALHSRGIGVVLDVVYNHTGDTRRFDAFAPGYYYRKNPDGSLANGSACGNDFNTEAPMARQLIIDSLKFWVTEYGVDGFRFDLMGLMDAETMRLAERELRALKPGILLYGEPWGIGETPMQGAPMDKNNLASAGYAAFNDDFRNAVKGPPDGVGKGFVQQGAPFLHGVIEGWRGHTPWTPQPTQSINYMTSHDNLTLYDKLRASNPGASGREIIRMMKLGYFLILTAQGVPFLHGGGEFAHSKDGNHNSFEAPDEINQLDWLRKIRHRDLVGHVRELIALRAAHPLFRLRSREASAERIHIHSADHDGDRFLATIDGSNLPGESWAAATIAVNGNTRADASFELPAGDWRIAFKENDPARQPLLNLGRLRLPPTSGVILFTPDPRSAASSRPE